MSRSEDHISFLDYVRGLAIVMVFSYHSLGLSYGIDHLKWNGWWRSFDVSWSFLALLPAMFGGTGVLIFFVVSGFCIHLSHERSQGKQLKVFFVRRFFRIYPPYLLALLFFVFVPPWTRVSMTSRHGLAQTGTHLLLVHNFADRSFFGINPSFWSIAVEVQLYMLYPLLLVVARRFGWGGALWLTAVVEILLRTVSAAFGIFQEAPLPAWVIGTPFYFWFSWTLGARLADDYLNQRPLFLSRCPIWVWPLMAFLSYFFRPLFSFCPLFAALAAANGIAFLSARSASGVSVPRFLLVNLRWVGVVSYSFYLLHQPLLQAVPKILASAFPSYHFRPLLVFGCCFVFYWFVLALSWLFFRFIEVPCIALGKWIVRTKLRARNLQPVPA